MRFIEIILVLFFVMMFSGTVAATDTISSDNSNLTLQGTSEGVSSSATSPTAPPTATVYLIFIHYSTGENWLNDDNGGLGIALRDNNYFVSDTNYGWGPNGIGSSTDIGNWWEWFRGPDSPLI